MAIEPRLGDVVQTRKQHPCGNDQWQVYRLGADIGLRCIKCDRRVLMPRREFNKSVKKLISRLPETTVDVEAEVDPSVSPKTN
ncbi:MAG: DUF951 domain-containing protein [Anaerolineae bacterium]|nr:DUF951 domain-containing protein [Anaerolineae bacterium]